MENEKHEEQRILVTTAILATIVGLVAIFTQDFMAPLRLVLGISGVLLFLYLLTTAAGLKYKHKGDLATVVDTGRIRPYLFDWGVSIYGLALFGGLIVSSLSKEGVEKILKALVNEDTILGWLALVAALMIWAGIYFCANVGIRIWALVKFKRWFWRTKTIREYQEDKKGDLA